MEQRTPTRQNRATPMLRGGRVFAVLAAAGGLLTCRGAVSTRVRAWPSESSFDEGVVLRPLTDASPILPLIALTAGLTVVTLAVAFIVLRRTQTRAVLALVLVAVAVSTALAFTELRIGGASTLVPGDVRGDLPVCDREADPPCLNVYWPTETIVWGGWIAAFWGTWALIRVRVRPGQVRSRADVSAPIVHDPSTSAEPRASVGWQGSGPVLPAPGGRTLGVVSGARKLGAVIVGWIAGVVLSTVASMLVAAGADSWQLHREGVGLGLFTLVYWFWGFCIGVLIVGPVVAVLLVRRTLTTPTPAGAPALTVPQGPNAEGGWSAAQMRSDPQLRPGPDLGVRLRARWGRSAPAAVVWIAASATVVAVGAFGGCVALDLGPCHGLPPHEQIARFGGIGYVLRSPDGSLDAYIWSYPDVGAIGLLTRDGATGTTGERTGEDLGGGELIPTDIAWMPDSRRLLIVFEDGGSLVGDRIGIFSFGTGSLERTFGVPFVAEDLAGIDVSPDGTSALVISDRFANEEDEVRNVGRLYRIDLGTGDAGVVPAQFLGSPSRPVYVDASHAVVVDSSFDRSTLSLVDLETGTVRELTPPDLNVVDVAGRAPGGEIVVLAYHSRPDGVGDYQDRQDPVIAAVDVRTGEVRELFAPGVVGHVRMQSDTDVAVALADTCSGDCSGAEVWVLDLSRYLE